jgi:hypothetical protein
LSAFAEQLRALELEPCVPPEPFLRDGPSDPERRAAAAEAIEIGCGCHMLVVLNDPLGVDPFADIALGIALAKAWLGTACRILFVGPVTAPFHQLSSIERYRTWSEALRVLGAERTCAQCGERQHADKMRRNESASGVFWLCANCYAYSI